jgi:hypothetical protein
MQFSAAEPKRIDYQRRDLSKIRVAQRCACIGAASEA